MSRKHMKYDYIIIILAVFLFISYYALERTKILEKDIYYDEKIKAFMIMQEALKTIRDERIRRGIDIDKSIDINDTGIIGVEYSSITTTLGSLEAKRTSANPSFAAVIVDMMKELKLQKGDWIAVNFSGSFPALNIAVLSAAEALELNPIVMASVGASTYGANIPEFNYIHMEELLYQKGIIHTKSILNSLGGSNDIGSDMDEDTRNMILNQLAKYERNILIEEDLDKNIEKRYEIYQTESHKRIKCFVNVGGNLVSLGGEGDWNNVGSGIIKPGASRVIPASGLIGKFLSQGIPVINIINIKELAVEYDLPIDPYPIPEIGKDKIYYTYRYPSGMIIFIIVMTVIAVYIYGKRVRNGYGK